MAGSERGDGSAGFLLEARGITKRFGGVTALDEAEVAFRAGEIHALLGANGAGKSTMVKILSGVHKPDAGVIRLQGRDLTLNRPSDAAKAGIGTVFQELSLFPHFTVAENVMIGHEPLGALGRIRGKALARSVRDLLHRLEIDHIDPQALLGDLPLADRQLVEIAKALSQDPSVLILDEGTSALGHQEVERLFRLLETLRSSGRAIIFISHRMAEIRELADRITVFRNGRTVTTAGAREIDEAGLVELMLGQRLARSLPAKPPRPDDRDILLEVDDMSAGPTLAGMQLKLRRGEIVGLSGLEGQGQELFLLALFGLFRRARGRVTVAGRRQRRLSTPWQAIRAGIALIPEDRKTEGLLQPLPIRENLTLASLGRLTQMALISKDAERDLVAELVDRLEIKAGSAEDPVRSLSGGNQQKVVLAKWLATDADIFLFNQPTRGIDVGTKRSFYEIIIELARAGKSILLYSTETSELVALCHRVLVLDRGRCVRELTEETLNESEILAATLGIPGRSAQDRTAAAVAAR